MQHILKQRSEYNRINVYHINSEAWGGKGIDNLAGKPQLLEKEEETDSTCEGKQGVVGNQSIKVESKKFGIQNLEGCHHAH